MASVDRQNKLIAAEDWKRVYQSFKNADFKSYDFDNLRRTMITYLRENYPEDFNDYVESSEYLALIDLIAYIGQSIAFRVDLNARENFLELASRRDSVLRLSRLLGYNAKRSIPSKGLLKFTNVITTENIIDSNGRNLSNQVITWNDTTNSNWYEQFITVLNAAFNTTQQFGNPSDSATINGIPTEQYRFNATNNNVPVFGFTKTVNGTSMDFEITSTTFNNQSYIYEEAPKVANHMACVYRNDGQGNGSANTGFFFNFTQGNLSQGTFTINQPTTNQSIDFNSTNINNTDIWLYKLDTTGAETSLWTQVPALTGNNIIYNSLNKAIKDIYSVTTKAGDQISLNFSDGTFGTLPTGTFRSYYRISNGQTYIVNPQDVRGVTLNIPYNSSTGQAQTLTITLALQSSVSNASASETNDEVKQNAPATYYTQNRMITGEDYNISPLSVTQEVAKVKAVNRSSSGISRYFDLVDPTGKYSSTNLFADDGIIYRQEFTTNFSFAFSNRTQVSNIIRNQIFKILEDSNLRNFYYSKFNGVNTSSLGISWYQKSVDSNYSTGYVGSSGIDAKPYVVGKETSTDLQFLVLGSLVKFVAPTGKYFNLNSKNALVTGTPTTSNTSTYIWTEVVGITGDGTASGTGVLTTGVGPIRLNDVIPSGATISQIIPAWKTTINSSVISTMIDLIANSNPFGLRYDLTTQSWQIVFQSNLNSSEMFSLNHQGDTTNLKLDSSWLLLFLTDTITYTVTTRKLQYIFESDAQLRFYFDSTQRIYDSALKQIVNDEVKILGINTKPGSISPFTFDQRFKIVSTFVGLDGYIDTKKIVVTFGDKSGTTVVQDPDAFNNIVYNSTTPSYVVLGLYQVEQGQQDYKYVDNSKGTVLVYANASQLSSYSNYTDGQYFYFTDSDTVLKLNQTSSTLVPSLDYKVFIGRSQLKFQYTHSADEQSRIDPGVSNIIDIFVLTKGYDIVFRQWLSNAISLKPLPPSSDELYNVIAPTLNLIKSISDEIIYHPVKYKILFGSKADAQYQAQFKVIVNPAVVVSTNDIKTQILAAINAFFELGNFDFGDTFYFSELSTYIMNILSPNITNFVIVPTGNTLSFGSLFEITAGPDELFISAATVDNIDVVTAITPTTINSLGNVTSTNNVLSNQSLTSSSYGSTNV
jgi:hypothetical protein